MFSPLYYVALGFLWLPLSALLAIAVVSIPRVIRAWKRRRALLRTRYRLPLP